MAEIIKIVIKGSSGYGCIDEAYEDKVTITPVSISYEYKPKLESEINPARKWSYRTNSPIFEQCFRQIANMTNEAVRPSPEELFCFDCGMIEFTVVYADKSKQVKRYFAPGDYFADYFSLIKKVVPECEYTPAVLLTNSDYAENSEE